MRGGGAEPALASGSVRCDMARVWTRSLPVAAALCMASLLAAGCKRSFGPGGSGGGELIGTAHSGDAELRLKFRQGFVMLSVHDGAVDSIELPLSLRADVDQALRVLSDGMSSTQTPHEDAEQVLSRMNAGRPEMRVVARNHGGVRELALVVGNRADASPAPTAAFPLTPESTKAVEALLTKARERLTDRAPWQK